MPLGVGGNPQTWEGKFVRRAIDILDRVIGAIALVSAWAACLVMLAITLLILLEIVLRSFFGTSTHITEEYVGYGLGAMVFLGFAHALRMGALVRVDLLLGKLPPTTRRLLEIVLCIVTLGVMAFVMYFLFVSVRRNFVHGTISMSVAATPIWIPEAIILFGMAIFTLTLIVYTLRLCLGGPVIQEQGHQG